MKKFLNHIEKSSNNQSSCLINNNHIDNRS